MNRGMPTIAVWFSCGAASAVAAKMTIDKYGKDYRVFVVNNPIKEDDGDNVRFKKDVEQWIGQPIIEAVNPEFPNASIYPLGCSSSKFKIGWLCNTFLLLI